MCKSQGSKNTDTHTHTRSSVPRDRGDTSLREIDFGERLARAHAGDCAREFVHEIRESLRSGAAVLAVVLDAEVLLGACMSMYV